MIDKIFTIIKFVLFIMILWLNVTYVIWRFTNPSKTEIEAVHATAKSFMLNFNP